MMHLGFDSKWIEWIMKCVETVSFSVLINGTPQGMIQPKRGIRQGDPLSPYLFVVCAEVLSHLLTKAATEKNLKGKKISNMGPTITHLLFADDALFFCHAHPRSCSTVMRILGEYEKISGQAVNLNKSAITFGSKVKHEVKTRL
ncbi:putative mitochondrial protein [Cardamine amara subsp. amara]|uniref:Mitochondrial protein n=1 Tax=Cardamine amara subsp. amara TaxID=228776 RepID=A0ABD1BT45_CARAN